MKAQNRMPLIREMLDEADHLIAVADKGSFRTLVARFKTMLSDVEALLAEARGELKKAANAEKPATTKRAAK